MITLAPVKTFPKFTDQDPVFEDLGKRLGSIVPAGLLRNGNSGHYSLYFGIGGRVVRCGRVTDMRRVLSFAFGEPMVFNFSERDIIHESAFNDEQRRYFHFLQDSFLREVEA